MPHWLADIGATAALATFFTELLGPEPILAWSVFAVCGYFLIAMFDELTGKVTGKTLLP